MSHYTANEARTINLAGANADTLANSFGNGSYTLQRLRQLATTEARMIDGAFDQRGRQPGVRSLSKIVQFFADGFEQGAALDSEDSLSTLADMPEWSAGAMIEGAACRKYVDRRNSGSRPGFTDDDVTAMVSTMRVHANACIHVDDAASARVTGFDAIRKAAA